MPIPLIVWAGAAAVGGWLAWKNRKAIGKALEAAGNALATKAIREVDELLAMPMGEAEHQVDRTVPEMDVLYWEFFSQELAKRAAGSSKGYALLSRANNVRSRARD